MADNPSESPTVTAMLVTVGGTPASAIHTLNEQKPQFICFFVSTETQGMIREKILPALTYTPEHYDWIRTPASQNLLECYRVLDKALPGILDKWGVTMSGLGVEYTGGTKPMSVAAVLATIDSSSRYFYVGATNPSGRDRDGIGVVLDGKESTWYEMNPWEVLAVAPRREIALLFNHGRFSDASDRTERLAKLAPPEMQPIYSALAQLINGYAQWDRFNYREAQNVLGRALKTLVTYAAGRDDPIRLSLPEIEKNLQFLGALTDKKNPAAQRLDFLDLLANAERRAANAGRYDDAVARLYSALEGLARNQLLTYGIKNSSVHQEQVPEKLRAAYIRSFSDPEKPGDLLRIGLEGSYRLLAELGDPMGLKYVSCQDELNQVLNARNQSRLAHGTAPVEPETYARLRAFLYDFGGVQCSDLPEFPTLRL
jgi:CRISPR-associated protein (TIGR02710 family)